MFARKASASLWAEHDDGCWAVPHPHRADSVGLLGLWGQLHLTKWLGIWTSCFFVSDPKCHELFIYFRWAYEHISNFVSCLAYQMLERTLLSLETKSMMHGAPLRGPFAVDWLILSMPSRHRRNCTGCGAVSNWTQCHDSWLDQLGLSENRVYSQWNSHLIGIMISKTIGFRGTLFSDTPN